MSVEFVMNWGPNKVKALREQFERASRERDLVAAYAQRRISSVAHGSDCSNAPRSCPSSLRSINKPEDAA